MDEGRDESKERLLYVFGQNEHGELGLGDTLERSTPTLCEASRGKEIESIAAGNELTAVLTNTGEVYSCGVNFEGQCGIQPEGTSRSLPRSASSFTKVFLEEPHFNPGGRVAQVHASNGCEHLTIVSEDGQLHNCGNNSEGQLGRGDTSQGHTLPRPVMQLLGRNVVKVACSYFHSVVVTQDYDDNGRKSDYETWTFGGNSCGQLGQGDRVRRVVPTPLQGLRGLPVLSVACGLYHTAILVAGGGLYAFGKNDNGQLGLQSREWRLSPERVKSCASVVFQQVACGYFHTVALSGTGQLLAFGRNDFGQLGLGHLRDTWEPTQVPSLEGKKIVQVACGSYHTVTLDSFGRVYPFGRNNHGQLGTGTNQDSSRPCYVEKLSGKFILQVAAGFYHTLCLAGPAAEGSNRDGGMLRRARSLNSDLYRLLGNPSRSDVSFVVEGKVIYGHRCIIIARCEPLGRMLEGSMKEAFADGGSIPLPDQRYCVFLAFLEFLYTDKVRDLGNDSLDVEFALDLFELADRYLVDALKQLCEDAILKTVSPWTAERRRFEIVAWTTSPGRRKVYKRLSRMTSIPVQVAGDSSRKQVPITGMLCGAMP